MFAAASAAFCSLVVRRMYGGGLLVCPVIAVFKRNLYGLFGIWSDISNDCQR